MERRCVVHAAFVQNGKTVIPKAQFVILIVGDKQLSVW
jgi:hypothetical protein